MIGSAIFRSTSGGMAVGPGASKYLFSMYASFVYLQTVRSAHILKDFRKKRQGKR
jgi:prenyltransferase beta subunit